MYVLKCLVSLSILINFFSFAQNQTVGVFQYEDEVYDAYTLFSPSRNTYLINNCGNLMHTWSSNYRPGLSVYLLDDGVLLRTNKINNLNVFEGGGIGGGIEKIDWNGDVIWSYLYNSETYHQHHDIEPLANGNILILAWEKKTSEEAIEQGRDPDLLEDNELWPEHIIEIEPLGTNDANIVWEWHLWDHLIQDVDSLLPNYGVVSEHPELLNINYMGPSINNSGGKADWIHANSIDYNEELDQIIIGSRALSEFWIIDHSTNIEEAAGHEGGNSGMGGDFLYRWGNPAAYDRGTVEDRVLFGQHNVQWIDPNLPGANNILIFNNGTNRPSGDYSSIDEIILPTDGFNYIITENNAYGPSALFWTYTSPDFYADYISGCQRLENGNTLICSGPDGHFFEVDSMGAVVWDYINPVYGNIILNQGDSPPEGGFGGAPTISNSVFRCEKIAIDFIGLTNYNLVEGVPIEGPPYIYPSSCSETNVLEYDNLKVLTKKVDILGREVNNQTGLIIEIYDDGSFTKLYRLN